jgi:hypothetical protein
MLTAIYNDRRADHEARELLLAVAYAVKLGPKEGDVSPLREARRVLGRDKNTGRVRYDALVAADAPRYKPPREAGDWGPGGAPSCMAPRLRPYKPRGYVPRTKSEPELPEPTPIRPPTLPPEIAEFVAAFAARPGATTVPPRDWRTEDGVCGAQSHHRVLEKDPRTGWITAHWFCKRHKEHADRVAAQVREQNEQAPEPIPNRGGLLPVYFKADWSKVYAHYRKGWTAPSYGLCADDWPTAEQAVKRGRFRVMAGTE